MRRHAKATSSGPNERKPSGRRGNPPSSRLRLTILLATVAAFLLVPAAQALAAGHLKVNIIGSGSGEVTSFFEAETEEYYQEPTPPIACSYNGTSTSGVCESTPGSVFFGEEYFSVQLKAKAAPGSALLDWTILKGEGHKKGHASACPLEPTPGEPTETCIFASEEEGEELEVTATFVKAFPLTIAKEGGLGTVASNPKGMVCAGAKTGAECEHGFEAGSTVALTASPATGYAFNGWSGCLTHEGLKCTVTMDKAKTVKAKFIATPSLTIEKPGTGAGKVGATGISCDENCSKAKSSIKAGTVVTVKAAPAKGSEAAVFEGGTGSASGCSGATCVFTISENSSVKVNFNAIPTKTLTVNVTGPAAYKGKVSGKGTVKGLTASAINCGAGCTTQTEAFFSTDEVELSAVAGAGYTFGGWSGSEAGTCTGKTTPCKVPTNANKTLSAEFK